MDRNVIESMLELWARFYYNYDFGGLGYPKRALIKPEIKSTKPIDHIRIPTVIEEIDIAINQLTLKQKLVINAEYLKAGKQKEKAIKLEITHATFRATLHQAKHNLTLLLDID